MRRSRRVGLGGVHMFRLGFVALVAGLFSSWVIPQTPAAAAAETYVCWVADASEGSGITGRVIRCRIAGGRIRDYRAVSGPPVWLYPAVGSDDDGTCWYRRSWWSGWSIVDLHPDATARLRFDPDGVPGGPVIADAVERACRSEPDDDPPDIELAWRILRTMTLRSEVIHPVPLDPITGLRAFVPIVPSRLQRRSVVSPVTGHTIEVEARPEAVTVDWGDGTVDDARAAGADLNAPRPDTALSHVYETASHATLVVGWTWQVRWRVDSGEWITLGVEPLLTRLELTIEEVVGRLT